MIVGRYVDCFALLALAPFVVLMDLPVLGYVAATAAWVLQRAISTVVERRARSTTDPRAFTGWMLASSLGRAWLVALTILAVGLAGEREDGLMAAVLTLAAFTLYFAISLILRPLERNPSNS
jgi:hypothetical protein